MLKLPVFILTCCLSIFFIDSKAQPGNDASSKTLAEKIDQYLISASRDYRFNGVALVSQKGKILLQKGYGWRDVKSNTLNDSSSIFQIGSITKQFTSTIILKLQEQGKLSVNDPLSKYFPGYPNGDKITLYHLLTHTSGISNYTDHLKPFMFLIKKTVTQKKVVGIFEDKPLAFEAGTEFSYTNSGYYLLGMIVEKVTGKPYEQLVYDYIFTPLDMTRSGFDFRNLKNPSKATGYSLFFKDRKSEASNVDSSLLYAAGGIYGTAGDLYKWLTAVSAKQIISADSWRQAFTPYKANYGLGWAIDSLYNKLYITHGGLTANFTARVMYYPGGDITIILLNNFFAREGLWGIAVALSQIMFDQPYPWGNQPETDIDENTLNQYTGTFNYPLNDKSSLFISVEGGRLVMNGTPAIGVNKTDLINLSGGKFYNKSLDMRIEFIKDVSHKTFKLITYREGMYTIWENVK